MTTFLFVFFGTMIASFLSAIIELLKEIRDMMKPKVPSDDKITLSYNVPL